MNFGFEGRPALKLFFDILIGYKLKNNLQYSTFRDTSVLGSKFTTNIWETWFEQPGSYLHTYSAQNSSVTSAAPLVVYEVIFFCHVSNLPHATVLFLFRLFNTFFHILHNHVYILFKT